MTIMMMVVMMMMMMMCVCVCVCVCGSILGRGAFGDVYEGSLITSKDDSQCCTTQVAVKVLSALFTTERISSHMKLSKHDAC